MAHLFAQGHVAVADAPAPIGFAATTDVGGATMLCDLFVQPDARSGGAGDALLSFVLPAGPRMTFSSKDPRALALYLRHGMSPRWPLLYLCGPPPARAPLPVDLVPATEAAAVEATLTGATRADAYQYWTSRPGAGAFVVRDNDFPVAAGCFGASELTHLVVTPGTDATAPIMSALTLLIDRVSLCVPGHHPVAVSLMSAGFRIDDFDTFFTSGPDPTDAGLVIAAPGLV
jgi:hypothetical protein